MIWFTIIQCKKLLENLIKKLSPWSTSNDFKTWSVAETRKFILLTTAIEALFFWGEDTVGWGMARGGEEGFTPCFKREIHLHPAQPYGGTETTTETGKTASKPVTAGWAAARLHQTIKKDFLNRKQFFTPHS